MNIIDWVYNGYVDTYTGIIWVNFITTEPCSPEPWNSWFIDVYCREIISFYGRKIQVIGLL